jgi:hypothetical protein
MNFGFGGSLNSILAKEARMRGNFSTETADNAPRKIREAVYDSAPLGRHSAARIT